MNAISTDNLLIGMRASVRVHGTRNLTRSERRVVAAHAPTPGGHRGCAPHLRLRSLLFSSNPDTAFNAGHAIFAVTGIFVLPLPLALLWPLTPGNRFTFRGALLKGVLFGLVLAVLTGLLLPLLGLVSDAEGDGLLRPGPFGLALGLGGPLQLLVGTQLYAVTFSIVAAMGRGLQPLDSVGWGWWSHGSGESP